MSESTPPGWHIDQDDPQSLRYWDGNQWTDQRVHKTPPGWHIDQDDPQSLRYWDGNQWTDQRVRKTPPAAGWSPARIGAVGGAVAILVGSVSPWATVSTAFGSVSVNGTEGDGVITLVGGIVVLLLIATTNHLGAVIISGLTGAALVYDLFNTSRTIGGAGSEFVNASVGWGLWVATIGAVVAFAGSVTLLQEADSLTADSVTKPAS